MLRIALKKAQKKLNKMSRCDRHLPMHLLYMYSVLHIFVDDIFIYAHEVVLIVVWARNFVELKASSGKDSQ